METKHCHTCHTPIPANAPGGFCPACLLLGAGVAPTHGNSPPPLEEIAATVNDPADVAEELRHLVSILSADK